MDAIQKPVVVEAGPGAWETFTTGVSDAAAWCGNKIHALGTAIVDGVYKVCEYVKPFFQAIGKAFMNAWDSSVEWIGKNKELSAWVAATAAVSILLTLFFVHLCSSSAPVAKASATAAPTPAPAAGAKPVATS